MQRAHHFLSFRLGLGDFLAKHIQKFEDIARDLRSIPAPAPAPAAAVPAH
jgi:hypothetical protein